MIQTKVPAMTEKQWSQQFEDLFKLFGWEGYHTWTSIHSARGWPDWSLVNQKQKRFICVELKSEKGKTTEHQNKWIENLQLCGVECYVWRPSDLQIAADVLKTQPELKQEETNKNAK